MVNDLVSICHEVGLGEDPKALNYRGSKRRAYIELTTEKCRQHLTMLEFLSKEGQTQAQIPAFGSRRPLGQGEGQSEGGGEGNGGLELGEMPPLSMLSEGSTGSTSTSTSLQEHVTSPTTGSPRQVSKGSAS